MYWAKRLGRNQVRTCAEAIQASHDESLSATIHSLERHDVLLLDSTSGDQELRTAQLTALYSLMWLIELRDHGIITNAGMVLAILIALSVKIFHLRLALSA